LISVNGFARHVSIWAQVTPTLEQLVRWFNDERITLGNSVPARSDPDRHSLISETAFLLAQYDRGSEAEPPAEELENAARSFILNLPRADGVERPLSSWEWEEVYEIRERIVSYTHWLPDLAFYPSVPGCGVVDRATADIIAGTELIEVKAVTRPFRGSDLRQMLTYIAMYYSSGKRIEKVTLLNPRSSFYASATLDFIAYACGGNSTVELLQHLVEWMTGLQVSA